MQPNPTAPASGGLLPLDPERIFRNGAFVYELTDQGRREANRWSLCVQTAGQAHELTKAQCEELAERIVVALKARPVPAVPASGVGATVLVRYDNSPFIVLRCTEGEAADLLALADWYASTYAIERGRIDLIRLEDVQTDKAKTLSAPPAQPADGDLEDVPRNRALRFWSDMGPAGKGGDQLTLTVQGDGDVIVGIFDETGMHQVEFCTSGTRYPGAAAMLHSLVARMATLPPTDAVHIAPPAQPAGIVDRIRAIARPLGWAIGAHGTMMRDIDLIAVPWTKDASHWRTLHAAIVTEIPLTDCEGARLGLRRGPFGRIYALMLQPGAESEQERFNRGESVGPVNPKGVWTPPAIDLSIVDLRDTDCAPAQPAGGGVSEAMAKNYDRMMHALCEIRDGADRTHPKAIYAGKVIAALAAANASKETT